MVLFISELFALFLFFIRNRFNRDVGIEKDDKDYNRNNYICRFKAACPVAASCKESANKGKQSLSEHKCGLMEAHDFILE